MHRSKAISVSNNRIDKVNSLLEQEISKIIQREVAFPDGVLVTLTSVDTAPNLTQAKAYISAYPEEKGEEVLKVLNKEVWDIQQELNKKLHMRPIPKIIFVLDKKQAEAGKIEEILTKIKNENDELPAKGGPPPKADAPREQA